jgi:hypothetical protein
MYTMFYHTHSVSTVAKIDVIYIYMYGARIAQSVQGLERLGYGLEDWGSNPGRGNDGIFSLRHFVKTSSVARPPRLLSNRYGGGVIPELKRPG